MSNENNNGFLYFVSVSEAEVKHAADFGCFFHP